MNLFLVSSTMLVLTILEKAQCFMPEDESASIRIPIHLVSSFFAGKHQDTVLVLLHEWATSDAMHKIRSALLESITTTNVALALIWVHVLCSRKNKENKCSGENIKDDNSAACATEESSVDHEYGNGQPNRCDDENSLMGSWAKGTTSIPSVRTKTGSRKRFPKNRRRIIRSHGLRRTKKYVPTLESIQEGFDGDASASSSC